MKHLPKHDEPQRQQIRRRLLAYKIKYKIGAPKLASLISEAHPNKVLINQRRVSRFLAGETDPEEAFLDWCLNFLDTVEAMDDPVATLGAALRSFCPPPLRDMEFEGVYRFKSSPAPFRHTMTITKDDQFWRVQQRSDMNDVYDGALVGTSFGAVAVVNARLTGSTAMFMLEPCPEGLRGDTLEMLNGKLETDQPLMWEKQA